MTVNKLDISYTDELSDLVEDVSEGIIDGVAEQLIKYGVQRVDAKSWICIVTEEWGETVAEYNKQNLREFEKELMQTMACLTRLLHEVRREHNGTADKERHLYVRHT